jgi:hypothetical protein
MEEPINSAEDLTKQTKIKYGTYCCGSTNAFFKVGFFRSNFGKITFFKEVTVTSGKLSNTNIILLMERNQP